MTETAVAKRPTVVVATPMYGGMCTSAYVQSILALSTSLNSIGYDMSYVFNLNESLIQRARNEIVHTFLKTDAEYLLFIDADHRFDGAGIARMVESDKGIIAAICPKKQIDWNNVRVAALLGLANLQNYTGSFVVNFKEPGVVEIDKPYEVLDAGTGIMLIKRTVFEEMAKSLPKYKYNGSSPSIEYGELITEFFFVEIDEDGFLLSEDYAFCRLWQELGHEVYVAPWVAATHVGAYEFAGSLAHNAVLQSEYNKRASQQTPGHTHEEVEENLASE